MPTLLVTGASSGIGRATALLAGARGYAVAVHYRTQQAEADRTVGALREVGAHAFAVQADLRSEGDIERVYASVERELGGLDAVVNSAAARYSQSARAITKPPPEISRHVPVMKLASSESNQTTGVSHEVAKRLDRQSQYAKNRDAQNKARLPAEWMNDSN